MPGALVPSTIDVAVKSGVVTLTGAAKRQYEREEAEFVAGTVGGVTGVENDVELVGPTPSSHDIEHSIKRAIERDAKLDARDVRVATSPGTVTLRGTVRSWAEHDAAVYAASAAPEVECQACAVIALTRLMVDDSGEQADELGGIPRLLCKAQLPCLSSGVPEGGDHDEPVAVPFGGLAELDVEGLPRRGDDVAVGEGHLAGEGPCGMGDDGDPVTASELDRVRGVDVHVGEAPQDLLHRCGVRLPAEDRFGQPGDERDHVWMVDGVDRFEVAGVEGLVAVRHQFEQVRGPARGVSGGSHEGSSAWAAMSADVCSVLKVLSEVKNLLSSARD
jgi:BON domain